MKLWKIMPFLAAVASACPAAATVSFIQTGAFSQTAGGIGRPDTVNTGPSQVFTDYATGNYAESRSDFRDDRFLSQVRASTAAAVRLNSLTSIDFLARASANVDALANQLPSHGLASSLASFDFSVDTVSTLLFSITTTTPVATPTDYISFVLYSRDAQGSVQSILRSGTVAGTINGLTYTLPAGIYGVQFGAYAESFVPTLTYAVNARSSALVGASLSIDSPAAPTSGVPEPATWAMMLSGFGLVGSVLRRRKAMVRLA